MMRRIVIGTVCACLIAVGLGAQVRTTMDGLPLQTGKPMTAADCLRIFPPDQGGGFCEWYGYATAKQADDFEARRGFVRLTFMDGTGDLWEHIKPAPVTPRTPLTNSQELYEVSENILSHFEEAGWMQKQAHLLRGQQLSLVRDILATELTSRDYVRLEKPNR